SFFQVICDKPPTLMVNIASYEDGSLKDTLRNVQETGELVIHVVSCEQSEIMNASSATFPHGISEFESCGIASEPAAVVRPPRVQKAVVAHECKLTQVIPYPAEKPRWHVIYAEVIRTHIDDRVLDKNGRIDILKLDVLGRLSGNMFCSTRELIELERPA
ncbi:MAG: flavin reductase family protein, partial [Anaerolineaceae bacterium]|nr:flavin reductase family protein [Anaerolineaceae bacterium]